MTTEDNKPGLKPSMGFWPLVFYGMGDMLGAGIYGVVGVAAGIMGNMLWLSFLVSMVAALLTGLSYASLGSRHPKAAGAAYITQRAFRRPFLSYVVGLAVLASGLTSMAAAGRAFAEYAQFLTPAVTPAIIIIAFFLVLAAINFWGLRESSAFNILCTSIELGGLLFIIAVGARYWGAVDLLDASSVTNPSGTLTAALLSQGAVLTFYAFIGFEDMINISEEVKDAPRVFPRGLVVALLCTSIVYMAVSVTAVSVVPHAELSATHGSVAEASGPLVKVAGVAAPWLDPRVFTFISLFAIANTALLNFIMGSRLMYGMARQGLLPKGLQTLHRSRQTPHVAIVVMGLLTLLLSLLGTLSPLASATSLLLLLVFIFVNASLVVLKRRQSEPHGLFEVPVWVPISGIIICAVLAGGRVFTGEVTATAIAAGLLLLIAAMYLVLRPSDGW